MANTTLQSEISATLIDALRTFPVARMVEHCGTEFTVSPFEVYASCPQCGTKIKLRSYSGQPELADVFDAVFEWLNQPGAEAAYQRRLTQLHDDDE